MPNSVLLNGTGAKLCPLSSQKVLPVENYNVANMYIYNLVFVVG